MYCTNCGKPNDDGAAFCTGCGAPLESAENAAETPADGGYQSQGYAPQGYTANNNAPDNYTPQDYIPDGYTADQKKSKTPLIIGIVCAVAAIGVLALLISLLGGRSWKRTLSGYMGAIKKFDLVSIATDYYPKAVTEAVLDEEDMTMSEYKEEIKDRQEDLADDLDEALDDNYDMSLKKFLNGISYDIRKEKDFTKKELREINERFEDDFDTNSNYVKAGKHVKLKITYKLDDKEKETTEFDLIKVGNKWYMSPYNDLDFDEVLNYYYW